MFSGLPNHCAIESGDDPLPYQAPPPDRANGDIDELWAQRGTEYVRLRVGEIERVESERDYVHIYNGERAYLLRATLTAIHARLGMENYLRIHRSAIVRIDRITAIRDRGYGHIQVMLESGAIMRVGRTYLKRIRNQLKRWGGMPGPSRTASAATHAVHPHLSPG